MEVFVRAKLLLFFILPVKETLAPAEADIVLSERDRETLFGL